MQQPEIWWTRPPKLCKEMKGKISFCMIKGDKVNQIKSAEILREAEEYKKPYKIEKIIWSQKNKKNICPCFKRI